MDAVDFAQANFRLALDWRDECISSIGEILKVFHDQRAAAKPDEETIFSFAKMFGSCVGEVYRRNHGATWGMVGMQDRSSPA